MSQPNFLYHYTSLNSLALILTNRTLCFNTLINVDDIDEAETSDMGTFGKYVYVSCWTDEPKESIAMWQMYTPNMHGVRICMPTFPFQKHSYKAGQLCLDCDTESYINLDKLFSDNKASIVPNLPRLIPITYTNDENLLRPRVRQGMSLDEYCAILEGKLKGNQSGDLSYSFERLGRFKKEEWRFQQEWRYWISTMPAGMKEMKAITFESYADIFRRLENESTPPPYERFFLELSDEAVAQMEVVFGPRMSEAEKILAKHLLAANGLAGKWRDSSLRIR